MRLNPFHIAILGEALVREYKGCLLTEAFSISKEEVYLVFNHPQCLKISFFKGEAHFQIIPFETLPKRNRLAQFKQLWSQKVEAYQSYELDRQFSLNFSGGYVLHFTLFGKFSQIGLFQNAIALSHFPPDIKVLEELPSLDIRIAESLEGIQKLYPFLTSEMIDELQLDEYDQSTEKQNLLRSMAHKYTHLGFVFNSDKGQEQIDESDFLMKLSNIQALSLRSKIFLSKKNELLKQLKDDERRLLKALARARQNLVQSEKLSSYKQKADIIMAFMHQIKKGSKLFKTMGFDEEQELHIKLDPLLSPQENAARYYKKSKNESKRIDFILDQIQTLENALDAVQIDTELLEQTTDVSQLKKLSKNKKISSKESRRLPYKRLNVKGLELRVGKSAKDNDLLLRDYSSPHDMWFHAFGVSGSHVILRLNKGQQLNDQILESASSIAAYYSKARNEQLAKVIYTYRKYVRKPKGAGAGAVLVEKEQSLLIEPSLEHASPYGKV